MDCISYSNLVLEITRRCNMCCAHCLRGEADEKDLTEAVVDEVLNGVRHIGRLTLTGGEPSLNIPILKYLASEIRARGIEVGGIYIVTNGKAVTDEFILALVDLYALCSDDSLSGLTVSQDMFHEGISTENIARLRTLRCYTEGEKSVDFSRVPLLDIGRAKSLSMNKRQPYRPFEELATAFQSFALRYVDIVGEVAVTVDGDILNTCDYAYDEVMNLRVSNVFNPHWVDEILTFSAKRATG